MPLITPLRKVAIVHDVLYEYGGSERVVEALLKIYPKADLYTFFFNKKNRVIYSAFNKYCPSSSIFQKYQFLSKLGKYFSILKLFSSIYFYFLNLRKYDLIISSSHSFNSKIVRKRSGAKHVCYLHTPPKYLYEDLNEFGWIKVFPFKFLFHPFIWFLRVFDKIGSKHPDVLVVNSKFVQKKVKKYYQRNSTVIYPPVIVPNKLPKTEKGSYYLFISRIVAQKGIDLVFSAAQKYKFPLVVVGEGYLLNKFKTMNVDNVKFLGRVPDIEISKIYKGAKALLYASKDEDFGIVPVEAMSHGIPVVAYKSGGVKETVVDGKTGVFFETYSEMGLHEALLKLQALRITPKNCFDRARLFNSVVFSKKISELVNI